MKKVLLKFTATLLSLIVVLSSMSFTIDKHYCGDTLVDVSYFGEADSCCDMQKNSKKPEEEKKKNCCNNETEFIASTTFDKEKVWVLTPKDVQFVVFYLYSYINLYQEVAIDKEFYKDFSPPDLVQDIQVLHETFLI
jgi:hypothetical protein